MNTTSRPVDGPVILRLALEWRRLQRAPSYAVTEEEVSGAFQRFLRALDTRPELQSGSPSGGEPDLVGPRTGPVDAVKTCPGESPPAGYRRPIYMGRAGRVKGTGGPSDPSLREIAKGTTGSGDDEFIDDTVAMEFDDE